MKIQKPFSFILKKDLLVFDINQVGNGLYALTSGKFKQIIKQSEYDAIMATQKPAGRKQEAF